jgi:predicted phage terminase large subunit-like protein
MILDNEKPYTLWEFFDLVFCPMRNLELPRKHVHKYICDTLEAAFLGVLHKRFIIINVPPRTGKTKICEAFLLWGLTYFPESQWMYASYSADLATESVRLIRDTLGSDWYTAIFGKKLGNIGQADRFSTSSSGNVFGIGNEGTLTGRGAGLKRPAAGGAIILDDPAKPSEAMSVVERQKLCSWFENTLMSRANSPSTPIVICAQRLAPDDLCGFVMEQYPDKYLTIKAPALDAVTDESMFPETRDTESLRDMRRVDPFAFAAQYQQEPIVMGGNLIKTEWFPRYDVSELESLTFRYKVIAADTALKTKTSSDYSVLGVFGIAGKSAYLIDVVRGKWQSPELLKIFKHLWIRHNVTSPVRYVYIEDASSGATILQDLRQSGLPVKPVQRVKDKVARVMDVLPIWATGRVLLPKEEQVPWVGPLLREMENFRADGRAKHDDQVDMMELATSKTIAKSCTIFDVLD